MNKEELIKLAKDKNAFDFQIKAIDWIIDQKNCLLALEQGLGKSLCALMSIDADNFGTIVVCPTHLKLNWRDEAYKWRPDLKVIVMDDTSYFQYPEPGELVILTYGSLPFWLELPEGKRKNQFIENEEHEICKNIILMFDEVHELKNNKTVKSKRSKELRKMAHKTIGITGTPILNRPLELWNMCSALGLEKNIFDSFPRFLYYFNGRKTQYGYKFGLPRPETPHVLRKAMIRITKDDAGINLPPKVFIDIPVELDASQRKIFDDMWDVFKDSKYYKNDELPPFEELAKEKKLLAESKIDALKQLVDELESQDIVPIVFSAHEAPIKAFAKRKGWKIITSKDATSKQRHKISQEFQEGKLKGLAATIRTAGTGLTLTYSNNIIFNDYDYVPKINIQAQDRAHRISQDKTVFIYNLVADHPLDRHIKKILFDKLVLSDMALEIKEEKEEISDEEKINQAIYDNLDSWIDRFKTEKEQKLAKFLLFHALNNIDKNLTN